MSNYGAVYTVVYCTPSAFSANKFIRFILHACSPSRVKRLSRVYLLYSEHVQYITYINYEI